MKFPLPKQALALPVLFLAVQGLTLAFPQISRGAAYIVMVLAPALTAVALMVRGARERRQARYGWWAAAMSLLIWAAGAFGNLWQEWVLGRANELYRAAMLLFNLAAVPIAFTLVSDARAGGRRFARAIDALTASALGYGFFCFTWAVLTARGAPDEAGVQYLLWLLDAANVYLTMGALARWYAADERAGRDLFRALAIYELAYLSLLFLNNHFVAGDPAYGPEHSSIITLAFALLAGFALSPRAGGELRHAPSWHVRTVHTASPIMLSGALLMVALFMIRFDYTLGTIGVLLAVLGYAARTTSSQLHYIEHGEGLQAERSQLQTIAWTDALTGVGNRHFLEQALSEAAHKVGPEGHLSVLMIDIDYFKLLNDR